MNKDLRQRIEETEYRGLTGEKAVEKAYHTIFARYDTPKTENDTLMTVLNPQGFRSLFEMYFALHPQEAQNIVKEHASQYRGLRKFLEPFAYFGNPVRNERYKAAKEQVEFYL